MKNVLLYHITYFIKNDLARYTALPKNAHKKAVCCNVRLIDLACQKGRKGQAIDEKNLLTLWIIPLFA